jgi:GrpB-like predicted nucleotidyltransferase (UPF0157 family)
MKDESKNIEITEYNPKWAIIYENESKCIKKLLGNNCLSIHHFGSTSVSGLSAKPKIDILCVIKNFSSINSSGLEQMGFENRGEIIPSGRYFSKKNPKVHLHIFEKGNKLIDKNLKFRDWLRTHHNDRNDYEKLKKELASTHNDGMSYCNAKTDFINKIHNKIERTIQNNQKKFQDVKKLNLPLTQYAITGSGPLGIRNLKEIGDIDIIVTDKLWEDLVSKYGVVDQNGIKKVVIKKNQIEIFCENSFYTQPKEKNDPNIFERIENSEIIDGLPFESLNHVLFYKQKMYREKDLEDIMIIEDWNKTQNLKKQ